MKTKTKQRPVIGLGDKARDTITGFTGIVIGRTEWLNGCVRLTVQAQALKDSSPVEPANFDIEQLELLQVGHAPTKETGGPMPAVTRSPVPARA